MKNYLITVFVPCYNASATIRETINSILNQTYRHFEIVLRDNASTDNTYQIISSYKKKNKNIRVFRNSSNLDYSGNLRRGFVKDYHGDLIVFMASDDILAKDALFNYNRTFNLSPEIGAVTRPYFWFDKNIKIPIRAKKQLSPSRDLILNTNSDLNQIRHLFSTLDQLSGLALRKKFLKANFGTTQWISHAYPFIDIFTRQPIVYLRSYTVAVRIGTSGTRSNIYHKSPVLCWVEMLNLTLPDPQFTLLRKRLISNFVATNYIGLLQIKNYGSYKYLFREIYYLLKLNPANFFNPQFWLFTLFTIFVPRPLSRFLTDWFKEHLYSRVINKISFSYDPAD